MKRVRGDALLKEANVGVLLVLGGLFLVWGYVVCGVGILCLACGLLKKLLWCFWEWCGCWFTRGRFWVLLWGVPYSTGVYLW